jgi:hypothetical protein
MKVEELLGSIYRRDKAGRYVVYIDKWRRPPRVILDTWSWRHSAPSQFEKVMRESDRYSFYSTSFKLERIFELKEGAFYILPKERTAKTFHLKDGTPVLFIDSESYYEVLWKWQVLLPEPVCWDEVLSGDSLVKEDFSNLRDEKGSPPEITRDEDGLFSALFQPFVNYFADLPFSFASLQGIFIRFEIANTTPNWEMVKLLEFHFDIFENENKIGDFACEFNFIDCFGENYTLNIGLRNINEGYDYQLARAAKALLQLPLSAPNSKLKCRMRITSSSAIKMKNLCVLFY